MSILNAVKQFYNKYPLLANCGTYGVLYVGAEFSQQFIGKKILTKPAEDIDKKSLGRYAIMGTFMYSPCLFFWYKWLDRYLPGTSKRTIVKKLLLDQFVATPPLLTLFFVGMSLMEMAEDPFEEWRNKIGPTFARSCLFWLPAQTVNFMFVSPIYRVSYIGTCSLVWANILCFVKRQKVEPKDN